MIAPAAKENGVVLPIPNKIFESANIGISLWPQGHLGSSILLAEEILNAKHPASAVTEFMLSFPNESQLQTMAEMLNRRHRRYQIPAYSPRAMHIYKEGREIPDNRIGKMWRTVKTSAAHRLFDYVDFANSIGLPAEIWGDSQVLKIRLEGFLEEPHADEYREEFVPMDLFEPFVSYLARRNSRVPVLRTISSIWVDVLQSPTGLALAKAERESLTGTTRTKEVTPPSPQMIELADMARRLTKGALERTQQLAI